MSDENPTAWVVETLNELITSLGLQTNYERNPPIQTVGDINIRHILEIFRILCNPPVTGDFDSTQEVTLAEVDQMISYIRNRYGTKGNEFRYLSPYLILDKDMTQLKFLLQVFELIHDHKLKSQSSSRRTSRTSTSLTSLTRSSRSGSSSGFSQLPNSILQTSNNTTGSSQASSTSAPSTNSSGGQTIEKVVVKVIEEDSTIPSTNSKTLWVRSIEEVQEKPKTAEKLTSSRLEFNKDEMLMVHIPAEVRNDTLLSMSTINTSDPNAKPVREISPPPSDHSADVSQTGHILRSSKSDSSIEQTSSKKVLEESINKKKPDVLPKMEFIKKQSKQIFNLPSKSSRSTNQSEYTAQDSTSYSASSQSQSQDRIEPPIIVIEEVADSNTNHEGNSRKSETIAEVKIIHEGDGTETTVDDSRPNGLSIKDSRSSASISHINSEYADIQELLRDHLDELEQIVEDLKGQKCGGNLGQSNEFIEIEPIPKAHKKKFPYYPYGIIHPKCKSIMAKPKAKRKREDTDEVDKMLQNWEQSLVEEDEEEEGEEEEDDPTGHSDPSQTFSTVDSSNQDSHDHDDPGSGNNGDGSGPNDESGSSNGSASNSNDQSGSANESGSKHLTGSNQSRSLLLGDDGSSPMAKISFIDVPKVQSKGKSETAAEPEDEVDKIPNHNDNPSGSAFRIPNHHESTSPCTNYTSNFQSQKNVDFSMLKAPPSVYNEMFKRISRDAVKGNLHSSTVNKLKEMVQSYFKLFKYSENYDQIFTQELARRFAQASSASKRVFEQQKKLDEAERRRTDLSDQKKAWRRIESSKRMVKLSDMERKRVEGQSKIAVQKMVEAKRQESKEILNAFKSVVKDEKQAVIDLRKEKKQRAQKVFSVAEARLAALHDTYTTEMSNLRSKYFQLKKNASPETEWKLRAVWEESKHKMETEIEKCVDGIIKNVTSVYFK